MHLKQQVNPKYIVGIDAIRFLAAAAVLAFHYGIAAQGDKSVLDLPGLLSWTHFGWVGVETFFVISGFVIAFSGEKAKPFDFVVSRIVRLGPGVWICATITLIVVILADSGANPFKGYVSSIFFVPVAPWIDPSYWTLAIEIAFYSMVLVLIQVGRFDLIRFLAITIGTASGIFWILATLAEVNPGGSFGQLMTSLRAKRTLDLLLVHHGMFFALGVFFWLQTKKVATIRDLFWCAFWLITGCLQIISEANALAHKLGPSYSPYVPCAIWLASVIAILISIHKNIIFHKAPQWLLRKVRTLGLMTFPLYLLHQVVGLKLMDWGIKAGITSEAALAVAVACVLLSSWVIATQLEPALQRFTKTSLYWLRLTAFPSVTGFLRQT